jgi:hypothetical protein
MRPGLRDPLLTMLLTLGLIGGGGAALATVGSMTTPPADVVCSPSSTETADPDPAATPTEAPAAEDGQGDDQSCDDQTTADDQDGDPQGDETGDQGDDVAEDPNGGATDEPTTPADTADPEREAECNAAAGVDAPGTDPTAGEDAVADTGLDHAIQQVLVNCVKDPEAPGLPNALRHLVANAARRAAHDAAKGAGEHGNSGVHGRSADAPGHSGQDHGRSDEIHGTPGGGSAQHGNPHH